MVDGVRSCSGFRCLDRDVCYTYDEHTKTTSRAHDSACCDNVAADELTTFQYRTRDGTLTHISADEAQELMQCTFTSKLLFERASLLCNYAFWGFAECVIDGFDAIPIQAIRANQVSPKVAIGHAAALADVETNPLGLFAVEAIPALTFLGEYTGVLQVHHDGANAFDAYGVSYPSVYEHGDLYVSAAEYGNAMRCINHSFAPNARFVPMLQHGILHIFCFTIVDIAAGAQVLVNYGPAYWKTTGVDPVAAE